MTHTCALPILCPGRETWNELRCTVAPRLWGVVPENLNFLWIRCPRRVPSRSPCKLIGLPTRGCASDRCASPARCNLVQAVDADALTSPARRLPCIRLIIVRSLTSHRREMAMKPATKLRQVFARYRRFISPGWPNLNVALPTPPKHKTHAPNSAPTWCCKPTACEGGVAPSSTWPSCPRPRT